LPNACRSELRQAEVQQLDAGFGGENIRGLQISMGDALLVRGVECVTDLHGILQCLIKTIRPK
jgi:hypothetical protein